MPVLIVTMPGVAEADTYSTPVSVSYTANGQSFPGAGDSAQCNVQGYWDVNSSGFASLKGNFTCQDGWDVSDWTSSWAAIGDGCGLLPMLANPGQLDPDGSGSVTFVPSIDTSALTSCNVTQFCWSDTIKWRSNPFTTSTPSGCVAWNVGPPPAAQKSCNLATGIQQPAVHGPAQYVSGNNYYQGVNLTGHLDMTTVAGGNAVYVYIIVNPSGSYNNDSGIDNYNGLTAEWAQLSNRVPGAGYDIPAQVPEMGVSTHNLAPPAPLPQGTVVGVGLWVQAPGSAPTSFYGQSAQGYFGRNDPSKCAFYWGQKVITTTDGTDQPAGPMVGGDAPPTTDPNPSPPPPTSSGCTFSWTDPSTWASGGICALVGIMGKAVGFLQQIVDELAHLASDIADAIMSGLGNLLQSLFIPPPGFWSDEVNSMQGAWDNTDPWLIFQGMGTVFTAVQVPDPGDSCAGPSFDVPIPSTLGGGDPTVAPFNTCDNGMQTVQTVVFDGLEVFVWAGGAVVGLRLLLGAFGVQLGSLGGDE